MSNASQNPFQDISYSMIATDEGDGRVLSS